MTASAPTPRPRLSSDASAVGGGPRFSRGYPARCAPAAPAILAPPAG
jgi:hypothetical protein